MKKTLIFLLVCLLMLPLSGCGGKKDSNPTNNGGTVIVDQPDNNENNETNNDAGSDEQDEQGETSKDEPKKEVIKPSKDDKTIICDNEYALIRLEEVEFEGLDEISVKVYMENKCKEQSLSFFTWTASVNGIQIDPAYAGELEAGKSKTDTVRIPTSYLQMCNIEKYTDISVTFVVYDLESMGEEYVAKGTLHFYPYGEEAAQKFVLADDPSYNVLMEQDDIKVSCVGMNEDSMIGYYGMLYIQNDSKRGITVSIDESTIDGVAASTFSYIEVEAGNTGFLEVYWTGEPAMEYDENGEPVESDTEVPDPATAKDIKIELSVYDTEDWEGPHIFYESVDIK